MNIYKKFLGHLNTVMTHRKYVRKYCLMCGLYVQGLIHDLSKYSPIEFLESVKYYDGSKSPINVCKEQNEYSRAWLHHRGRNKHHWEYWLDRFEAGGYAIKMPWRYVLEMFCDFLDAGIAYSGGEDKFDLKEEIRWWQEKKKTARIHPKTVKAIDMLFRKLYYWYIKTDGDFDLAMKLLVKRDLRIIKRIYLTR